MEKVQNLTQYNTPDPIFDTPRAPPSPLEQLADELESALQESTSCTHTPELLPNKEPEDQDSDKASNKTDTAI